MYPPGRRMRAPGGAGLRALPDPAEPEPGACREPGSRPRGIGGRPADRSSSFGRRFHGQGPWSAAGASGIRCEDATVGVVVPRFRCAKSPASMPDALTGGQRACSTYGDRVPPEPNPVMRIVSIAVLGTMTGALASLAAILFVKLVVVLNDWLLISARSRISEEWNLFRPASPRDEPWKDVVCSGRRFRRLGSGGHVHGRQPCRLQAGTARTHGITRCCRRRWTERRPSGISSTAR